MIVHNLRDLYAAAWTAGLRDRAEYAPELPVTELPERVPLDDTGRPTTVPLRPTRGDRA